MYNRPYSDVVYASVSNKKPERGLILVSKFQFDVVTSRLYLSLRLPTKAILVWLGTSYICNWLSGWLYLFCLVVTFRPRFHNDYLAPSATALSKRLTMLQMFLLNCLPRPLYVCVLKDVRTRLIILTGGKNNHKIKIAEIGQLAVGTRPLDCKYTVYHFRNTEHIDYL